MAAVLLLVLFGRPTADDRCTPLITRADWTDRSCADVDQDRVPVEGPTGLVGSPRWAPLLTLDRLCSSLGSYRPTPRSGQVGASPWPPCP